MNFDYIYQNGSFEEQINGNFDKIDKLETLSVASRIDDHEDAEAGKLYLVDENEDELLAGKEGQIVWYDSNLGWQFYQPAIGKIAYLQDEGKFYYFDGTAWQEFSTGGASQVISGGSGESIDLSGYMQKSSNLNDLANKATARSNLNVYSKSETYTKSEVDNMIDEVEDDFSNYYNKTETYSKTEVNTLIANIPSGGGGTIVNSSSNVVGDYKMSAQTADHDNWFICNGRAISRTEYSELFALVGTTFGEGDGSTTFNIPDFRDKTMWGANGNLNSTLAAGLPNITGQLLGGGNLGNEGDYFTGAFSRTGVGPSKTSGAAQDREQYNNVANFDASCCSSIYGNSSTVRPPAICVNVFIFVG